MTTRKQYIPDVWNNDNFSENVTIYQKPETDIGKVADGTDFAPATNQDIPTYQTSNITANEEDDTSAVNVAYVSGNVEELNLDVKEKVT